jgi:beta-glucosidase
MRKKLSFLPLALALPACCFFVAAQAQTAKTTKQPVLGYRSAKLIEADGLQFKDLNRNGKLDKYEDWRLSNKVRSLDLLSRMSVDDKVGFMLISSAALKNESSGRGGGGGGNAAAVTSDFNEEDRVSDNNIFTRKPLPTPIMNVAGTTKGRYEISPASFYPARQYQRPYHC